jgi:serine/threonine protein kinase
MKRVGDYVLVSELGKGQFGIVYKAKHVNTGDVYAIKTVKKASISSNPKLKSLFDTEINIMSKIKHPNILHLYEYLETGNNFYLIIDYCNNGDMESHVKKFNFLGEDESVYFLMQIMNGFRELHKHKIMHRDFKLANIFLHDDKLIVGDFGFAKSGHEMAQTKLGSPITMAPEMLLAQNTKNLVYTNKADLWSIGVCFYQMIFGQLPWEVSDLDDLKQKVQTDSGKNLQFPIDKCPITQECKDLLISLLEVDPVKRIEWDNFFNHKVFAIHEQKKQQKENALKMRTSVMFRNNEENVKKLFEQNKKDNTDTVELAQEPEDIKLGPQSAQALKNADEMTLEKIKERVLSRYTHEKKTIVFFMYTCRKLRNLAKDRATFKKAANGLMFVAIMLLKKGIIMNQKLVDSICKNQNEFGIEGFDKFPAEDKARLVEELESKDSILYTRLFSHLKDKLKEEVGEKEPRAGEILKLVDDPSTKVATIEPELRKDTFYLVQYFSKSLNTFSNTQKYEMMMALAHLYTAAHHESYITYLQEGVPFDWNEFDKSWLGDPGVEKINKLLNTALTTK